MEKKLWQIEIDWEQSLKEFSEKNTSSKLENSKYFVKMDEYRPRMSDYPVHKDDSGSYFGLAESVLLHREKPVFVVDNHNKALFAFLELKDFFDESFSVINIDAHPDDRKVQFDVPEITENNIKEIYNKTKISDFFDVANKGKLIKNVENVVNSTEFLGFTLPEDKYILSLDIDIFGPEGDYVDIKKRIRAIAMAWQGSSAIVIATSPGFIEQDYANEIIKIMCKRKML